MAKFLRTANTKCSSSAGEPTFEFVCLLPLFDPPRHDTKETIDRCREKGISVKMVTGDQLLIGKETARQLGLGTDMYSTEVLLSVSPACFRLSSLPTLASAQQHHILLVSSCSLSCTHAISRVVFREDCP